jgi:2-methylcitrate dehydratase PrpD
MFPLTAELGRFVAELTLARVPERGREIAKTGFADCFGVMIAGAADPTPALVDRVLSRGDGGSDQAALFPSDERRSTADAALVNGVAAHVLDYDDVALGGHPSAVLVPAILAQAEASRASGADMLTAYIAGYEVWAELMLREPVPLHEKGWHPTTVRGTVGAAAACAKLRGLNAAATTSALAIASSMASGLVANFGTMTKSFQVGRAAQSGLLAAKLAHAGLTASLDALEHRAGFLAAFSPAGNPRRDQPLTIGNEFQIVRRGVNIKRYPVCYAAHRAIDATLELAEKNGLKAEDVAAIQVATGQNQLLMLRNAAPQTALEAKFSMQFALASALLVGKVGLPELTDDFVRQPAVQTMFPRVSFETTTATMEGSALAPSDAVELVTRHGLSFKSGEVFYAKGSHQLPLSRQELWTKFADCLGADVPDDAKARAFGNLMILERLKGPAELSLRQ